MSFYDDASLVLIPSGIKASKVYSQKPTSGTGDLTFSRASTATRTNSAGLIEKVRTNLVLRSEEFGNTYWTTSALNVSVSSNVVAAPDGTNTADLIVADAITSNTIYVRNGVTLPSTGTYTFSVYAKKQNQNTIGLRSISSGTLINYDLNAETSTGGFIQNVGGGWFRIGFSYTTASTSESIYIYPLGTGTRTGNGVDGVYVWGAQLEAAEAVSDYIPTTTAAVTVGPTNNVPRLDYSAGATCPRLLSEGQRTNLVLRSETFDNASWTKTNVTITANATTSPDGTANADKIVGSAVSGDKLVIQTQTITIAQALTVSAFYKKSEYKLAFLRVGGQSTNPYVIYNLDTQAVVSTADATSTRIEDYGNGWYRISLSLASPTGSSCGVNISFAPDSGYTLSALNIPQYTGDGTSGGFAWGCQLEANGAAFGSSYIPTTTAAVTRIADAASKTGISSLIGQTEGVLFWEGIVTQQTDIIAINRSTVNGVYITKGTGNLYRCSIYNSSNIITLNDTTVRTTNTKIALAYKSGDSALFVNGVKVATSASAITFSGALSEIRLNDNYLIASAPQSANQINVYGTRLTDAQCIELTTL